MVLKTRAEPKIPIEQLQEKHLTGPAEEDIEDSEKALKVDEVVPTFSSSNNTFERITFRNQRDPGMPLEFHAHTKDNPYKQYKLIDGKEYTLPKEIIKNLEGCRENIHKYRRNADGIPEIYIAGYKTHFVCERT
jgi:hypothetical protein